MGYTPDSPKTLYGTGREMLEAEEHKNEILADIAGEEYVAPDSIPNGGYVRKKRMLKAAQKTNDLLDAINDAQGGAGSANKLAIDYGTDILSLKHDNTIIPNSSVTLPGYSLQYDTATGQLTLAKNGTAVPGQTVTLAGYGITYDAATDALTLTKNGSPSQAVTLAGYGLSYDSSTGGLTLTKNGTPLTGQTVALPVYGAPQKAESAADMVDTDSIYVYVGTTTAELTNGDWYLYDTVNEEWVSGGTYNSFALVTDTTLSVEGAAADAKVTGKNITDLKNALEYTDDMAFTSPIHYPVIDNENAWGVGKGIAPTNGAGTSNSKLCRTDYVAFGTTPTLIYIDSNVYEFIVWEYSAQSISGATFSPKSVYSDGYAIVTPKQSSTNFRISVKRKDEADMTNADVTALISAVKCFTLTDKTLALANVPADAKAVKDAINEAIDMIDDQIPLYLASRGEVIPQNSDLNTYKTQGSYYWLSYATGSTISNTPSPYGSRLIVMLTSVSNMIIQCLIATYTNTIYYRFGDTSTDNWDEWKELATTSLSYATNDYASRKLAALVDKVKQTFTPFNTIDASGNENAKFTANKSYTGIPYSAMNWADRDVLFDLSLEAMYTAFRNPYSDLYTYDWTVSNPTDRNGELIINYVSGAVWAGSVCSTWVSWATGRPFRMTVNEIGKRLIYKQINGVEDLEIGDVMIVPGHVALINGFKTNKDGQITEIEVSEMAKPLFRNLWYKPDAWWERYLNESGDNPYRIGRFEGDYNIKSIPSVNLVSDLISNKGDNVNFNLGDDIWIYATDSDPVLTVTAPDGTTSTIDYTTLPQQDSNPVYNFKSVFNSVGEWKIKGTHGTYDSRYTIYQLSGTLTAVETNGVTSVTPESNFVCNGVDLVGYQLMALKTDMGIFPISESDRALGYWAAYGTEIPRLHQTVDALPITGIDTAEHVDHFFIRVIFKTPAGLVYHNSTSVHRN